MSTTENGDTVAGLPVFFSGDLSPQRASLYARWDDLPGGQDWTVRGTLRGPHCRLARTLPVTVAFQDLGAGPTLLARAVLTDPCYWSSELPACYLAVLELRREGEVVQQLEQPIGIRDLEIRGRNLYWAGQRWVLRGVHQELAPDEPLASWRELAAAMVVRDPSDELCREASAEGVPLVVPMTGGEVDAIRQLRRLGRWPAVLMAVFDPPLRHPLIWKRAAPQVWLASSYAAGELSGEGSTPDIEIWPVERLRSGTSAIDGRPVPVMAWGPTTAASNLAVARLACDALQRELAPANHAGYLVSLAPA
ncbi:MAG: hypothetical protein AB7F89_03280 [Pirellulaceae bacterium]